MTGWKLNYNKIHCLKKNSGFNSAILIGIIEIKITKRIIVTSSDYHHSRLVSLVINFFKASRGELSSNNIL